MVMKLSFPFLRIQIEAKLFKYILKGARVLKKRMLGPGMQEVFSANVLFPYFFPSICTLAKARAQKNQPTEIITWLLHSV